MSVARVTAVGRGAAASSTRLPTPAVSSQAPLLLPPSPLPPLPLPLPFLPRCHRSRSRPRSFIHRAAPCYVWPLCPRSSSSARSFFRRKFRPPASSSPPPTSSRLSPCSLTSSTPPLTPHSTS